MGLDLDKVQSMLSDGLTMQEDGVSKQLRVDLEEVDATLVS